MKRTAERKAQVQRRFARRSSLLLFAFAAAAVALVASNAWHAVVDRERLKSEADARHLRTVTINAHRGNIVDRNGEPIAVSTPVDSIGAIPKDLAPAVDRFGALAAALGTDADQLLRRINRNMARDFVFLRRHLRPSQVEAVNALELPGLDVRREYKRYYPAGEVTAHFLGYTDIDDKGLEGFEAIFDTLLSGKPGAKRVLRDNNGRIIEEVASIRPPRPGQQLIASIDLRLQYFAYRELKRAMQVHGAQTGALVVLDVDTGEVLAMVNQPEFNPNNRSEVPLDRVRNHVTLDNLEPGSTIKPIILAAALSSGAVKADTVIDTSPGKILVGSVPITDKRNLGEIDLTTLLARSSNVGATKVAMRMEPEQLWRALGAFGFGELTGSLWPYESTGKFSHYEDWSEVTQAVISYGYGLSATPLQLARAYAAIGSGGILRPVSLVANPDGVREERIIDEDIADTVLGMMERVVMPGGTGTKAAIPGYRVAGKTGTSKKVVPGGGYSEDRYLSIFAGLVPASRPKLAAVVVIDEPGGDDYYGGDVAAPVFSEVMREALRLRAIAPDAVPGVGAGSMQAAR